jgi:hypothetical protein
LWSVQEHPRVWSSERLTFVCLGLETDPIQIDSIEVSPDPPVPGQNLTVIAKGQVTEVIEVRMASSHVGFQNDLLVISGWSICRCYSEAWVG